MQLAMLIVLILILLVLSPAIFSLFITLTVVLGVFLTWLIAALAIVFLISMIWLFLSSFAPKKEKVVEVGNERKNCSTCQVEIPAHSNNCYNCGKQQ